MKKILVSALCAFALVACIATSQKDRAKGVVSDVTNNNVVLITATNDTLSLCTKELQDAGKMIDIFLGDTVNVEYKSIEGDSVPNCYQATNVELVYRQPFYSLVGEWVQPIVIDPSKYEGFAFNVDGTASSINMHTLVCHKWAFDGNKLTLTLESIGNRQTFISNEVYDVEKVNADSLILLQDQRVVWRLARLKPTTLLPE